MVPILSSWKEIAQHLGKGIRTVQRWEGQLGLPVHRPSGSTKGIVLAYPTELDAWAKHRDIKSRANSGGLARRNWELVCQLRSQVASLRRAIEVARERLLSTTPDGRK